MPNPAAAQELNENEGELSEDHRQNLLKANGIGLCAIAMLGLISCLLGIILIYSGFSAEEMPGVSTSLFCLNFVAMFSAGVTVAYCGSKLKRNLSVLIGVGSCIASCVWMLFPLLLIPLFFALKQALADHDSRQASSS